jgi:hypothetical protein
MFWWCGDTAARGKLKLARVTHAARRRARAQQGAMVEGHFPGRQQAVRVLRSYLSRYKVMVGGGAAAARGARLCGASPSLARLRRSGRRSRPRCRRS